MRLSAWVVLLLSIALTSGFSVKGAADVHQSTQAVIYVEKVPAWAEQKVIINIPSLLIALLCTIERRHLS